MGDAKVEQRHRDEADVLKGGSATLIAQALANAEQRGRNESNEWREAVEDAAVVNWTLHEGDAPHEAVNRLLAMAASEALDPSISGEARALLQRGRIEGAEAALAWAFSTNVADESIVLRAARIVAERWPTPEAKEVQP